MSGLSRSELREYTNRPTLVLREAVDQLDRLGKGVVLLVEGDYLVGLMTDGDLRRFLLRGGKFNEPVSSAMNREFLTWPADMGRETGLRFLKAKRLRHLPIVDDAGRLVDLLFLDEDEYTDHRNKVVIMAGGIGSRLRPHTEQCPKPMLEVDGKPMLEHIVRHFMVQRFRRFIFAVNYLGHMIEDHFGDGHAIGAEIEYLREEEKLGTGGALSLIQEVPEEPFFVTNGDVLTRANVLNMLQFHELHKAVATIGIRSYETQVPFGVVQIEGSEFAGIEEKPMVAHQVNAGFYCLSPSVLEFLEPGKAIDMPDLLVQLKERGLKVVAFPIHEVWVDVGRPDDLAAVRKTNPLKAD